MRNRIIIALTVVILLLSTNIFAEFVFIKDGSILEGTIISETGDSVTLRRKDRKVIRINRSNIMRILYTELYMGKVYVQRNDGKVIVCYMVDEDRNSFTFRYDIEKPKEFSIPREKVLFIARGNPTGLEVVGKPKIETVNLKWFPPYNKAKGYTVYLKAEGQKEFKLVDKTSSDKIHLKKLKSNTKYYALVKALDSKGDESLPSNEIEFKTANRPPARVPKVETINLAKEKKGKHHKITWDEAIDADGKVVAYRIYKIIKREKTFLKELKIRRRSTRREYVFKEGEIVDAVVVTAIDNQGAESKDKFQYVDLRKEITLEMDLVGVRPAGDFTELSEFGYGLNIRGNFANFLYESIDFGLNLQFISFVPKSEYNEDENELNALLFMPLTAHLGFTITFAGKFKVLTAIHFGGAFVYANYNHFEFESSSKTSEEAYEISGIAGFETGVRYSYSESIYFNFALQGFQMYESDGSFAYYTMLLGAGYRF